MNGEFNLAGIPELWRRGAFGRGPVDDRRANDKGVPAFVLTAALFERFASRNLDLFQNEVLSAMRFGFSGTNEAVARSSP